MRDFSPKKGLSLSMIFLTWRNIGSVVMITNRPLFKDVAIGLIKQFYQTPAMEDAIRSFLKKVSHDLIHDLESQKDKSQNTPQKQQYLIQVLQCIQDENIGSALKPLIDTITKVDNWAPEPQHGETGEIKVVAENALKILQSFGLSALSSLIDAYLDDSDFDKYLGTFPIEVNIKVDNENRPTTTILSRRALLLSYKVIKNQRIKEEIERFGPYALHVIADRLHGIFEGPIYQKLRPIYEKLQEMFSIKAASGYSLLL
jgi:hypothetical protein